MDPLRTEFEFPEKKKTVDFYPFRVWLSTLFFGPVLIILAAAFNKEERLESLISFAGLCFVFSLLATLPFLCIHWYLYDLLIERQNKNNAVRLTLCLVAAAMILLTIGLISDIDFEDKSLRLFACAYIASNIAVTWFFKFAGEKKEMAS
ncbi:hypothetical protein LZZ85_01420 [Terrimonas sp. NA20]|uniref:Uncharacterized protein n=1 Tax=Terrimonas ginsenosidimutans TaxID=2908004 RepID=A0ABS9KKT0_9BACT|nr:hypothetical protein [Terrimonas ginsenosidimutans]MCG2612911.1 hypothetical protein [Terrimonas ginsenosidimutans]